MSNLTQQEIENLRANIMHVDEYEEIDEEKLDSLCEMAHRSLNIKDKK